MIRNANKTQIEIGATVTASLSYPDSGPRFSSHTVDPFWTGTDPVEAARVYYEQSRNDTLAHPSGGSGRITDAYVPESLRPAFEAALERQHDERDEHKIISRLPALPDGWDCVTGTQYDPAIIALRSPRYRETTFGDVVFLCPNSPGYDLALAIARQV